MNSFLIKRIIPFFLAIIAIEFFAFSILLIANQEHVDWSFLSMIKTIGILLKTTSFAFLYVIMPYVFYLLLIPIKYINTKIDKILTQTTFALFVFFNLFEESMSLVFWEKHLSSFNQEAVQYLINIPEQINEISRDYLFITFIVALLIITFLIVRCYGKYLFTPMPQLQWHKRFIYIFLYILCCCLVFVNFNEDELRIEENTYNNEISKDGTYSLALSVWKNNLSQKDFSLFKQKNK